MYLRKAARRRSCLLKILVGITAFALAIVGSCLGIIVFWPDVAAQNIGRLRDVIGDAPVAQLEDTVLSLKDQTQQLEYKVGLVKPAAPWVDSPPTRTMQPPTPILSTGLRETATDQTQLSGSRSNTARPSPTLTPAPPPIITTRAAVTMHDPTSTHMPTTVRLTSWQPSSLRTLGNLASEGQSSPYLYAS